MKKNKICIFFLLGLLLTQNLRASHIAGGDLSYVCLGNNQYQINLNLFVDCLGFDPGANQTITFTSSCGGSATATVNVINPGGTEISQLCPAQINNSTCNGGTLPGMWGFHFTGTVTLAPACDTWTMSWTTCCRNAAILNLQTPDVFGSYIQATLNSVTAPCNSSPSFTSQPIPYVCVNQQVNYNYGVVETDGDSMYYSLINAMDANAVNLAYVAGYSASSPIPGITINPITGVLTFTPTMLGNFVVVVLVQEYDSNGNLIGTVMRDIQFIVQSCSNIVPDPTAGAISNLTGTAVQTSPFSIEMCEGSSFTFDATYTDANAGDVLTLVSNISTVLAGSTLTTTGANPLVATITWTAPGGSANTNTSFSVTVNDGACPVMGQQTFVYDINVQPRTLAGPDHIICGIQSVTLTGTGGSLFTWNVISGPAMIVGTNFSCNPCANPIASPNATTTYEVVSNLSGTCVNKDTVTVTVVPDFSFVTIQTTDTLCLQQLVQLNITGSPAGAYTYLWSPPTYLNNITIANPTANVTVPGTYSYYVDITSPLGCLKKDTATITILPDIRTRVGPDTVLCISQSAQLNATSGSSFSWNVLSGTPMVVGTNFSCNPCANPIATPTVTTVYQVTSNLNGTCINKDTITVTVVPNFSYVTSQSSTSSCLLQPIQFNAVGSPAGTYTYDWSPSTYLNNTTIADPVATISSPGTYTYYVNITSPLGCVKIDTASITITASYPPNPVSTVTDTVVCVGDTVLLGVTFGTSVPSVCGTNPIGCSAALVGTVGTGTTSNSTTSYPAPYGNWYTSAKHQFLFKASELIAAGITGGKIDQIDFNVSTITGITAYHEYTINMGCTNLTTLTNWVTGLSNVYTPKTYNVASGWNGHVFDLAYEWDGISNVVVEICFSEMPPTSNYTNNCSSPYTTTTFTSCLYSISDVTPQCPNLGLPTTTNNRPNVRFHYCGSAPDSTKYTYTWMPLSGVFNPHTQTTGAIVSGNTNYYVIVTDTVSGCLDTAFINIYAGTNSINVNAGNDVTICPGASTTLQATGASQFIWSPPTALSSTTIANPSANPTTTITYTVTGTSQCVSGQGMDSVKVIVPIVSPLTISAGDNQEVCVSTVYGLNVASSGGYGNNTYAWTLLSGAAIDPINNANTANASVTPTLEGTNTYQITTIDACGNSVTDTVLVNVLPDCDLEIPNIFTPNGDGENDYFIVNAKHLNSYSIVIYNRWGKKVFESNDVNQSWDGKNNEDGTYFYIIKAEGIDKMLYDKKGYLQRLGK